MVTAFDRTEFDQANHAYNEALANGTATWTDTYRMIRMVTGGLAASQAEPNREDRAETATEEPH